MPFILFIVGVEGSGIRGWQSTHMVTEIQTYDKEKDYVAFEVKRCIFDIVK